MSMIDVGTRAPEFHAPVGDTEQIALSGLRGRPVVLAFYPVTFGFMTGVGG